MKALPFTSSLKMGGTERIASKLAEELSATAQVEVAIATPPVSTDFFAVPSSVTRLAIASGAQESNNLFHALLSNFRSPGVNSLIRNGHNGLLADDTSALDDQLTGLLRNIDLRMTLGSRARGFQKDIRGNPSRRLGLRQLVCT